MLERDHSDLQLIAILRDELLGVIRTIKVLSQRVLSGASMVTANNKVGCAIIFADNSMPYCLTGPCHTHGKGEECEVSHAIWILGHDRLVDANASIMVDVTGFGETANGVYEDIRLVLARGTDSQLAVCSVHRVARLECDDLLPYELLKLRTELQWGN